VSPETIEVLIRAAVTVGAEAAIAISKAVHAGDVDTVSQLSAVLPDEHRQQLEDEALIQRQRALAGVVDAT
jgi:hypothetical protein